MFDMLCYVKLIWLTCWQTTARLHIQLTWSHFIIHFGSHILSPFSSVFASFHQLVANLSVCHLLLSGSWTLNGALLMKTAACCWS